MERGPVVGPDKGIGGTALYKVDKQKNGVIVPMKNCKTMEEAVTLVEEDRTLQGGADMYHIERDDGKGIGDEMDYG